MSQNMPEFTPDVILSKIKRGERLERADLRGVNLARAPLEGANLRRCDLEGSNLEGAKLSRANLKNASLREAYLVSADLREANLDNADLEGANLEGAILAGANLSRANLEGANLVGADLTGAKFSYAQLDSANLGCADLSGAVLSHADLVEAYLGAAKLLVADLSNANLRSANLEEADFTDARLNDAELVSVNARAAKFIGASLLKVNLSNANLTDSDLEKADARHANLVGATLDGANVNGLKVGGLSGTGKSIKNVRGEWIDVTIPGDGSSRAAAAQMPAILAGETPTLVAPSQLPPQQTGPGPHAVKRYFGRGDTFRNASLEFDDGASVEIQSLFEQCSITLGHGVELVIGKSGILAGCQINGFGKIVVNGHYYERSAPGIVGPREVIVTAGGTLVGAVEQAPDEGTRFAFEPGSKLRMKISKASQGKPGAGQDKAGQASKTGRTG
ncbi:pentapeptide repeat-containing protein [Pendulispora albinea]|uniref:Pentapeptide repeat-containing protein n=1 Tax=Pendulispora albinea TaxID=2741071 RepID=A0ABZ2LSC8_9BACT